MGPALHGTHHPITVTNVLTVSEEIKLNLINLVWKLLKIIECLPDLLLVCLVCLSLSGLSQVLFNYS